MTLPEADLVDVAPGVVRVEWPAILREAARDDALGALAHALERAFKGGASRVEIQLDPDDSASQRVATMSGLMKEGVARGVSGGADQVVYARLADDTPLEEPMGFRRLLNSFLPRKRAISQLLVRAAADDGDGELRVLLCQLTYKRDWDLPGGVVEVGESPQLAVTREIEEELGLTVAAGSLVLTDWLPPWGGWDDAVCLVFDGGEQPADIVESMVYDRREIRSAAFCTLEQVHERCADFTARRIVAALASLDAGGPSYTESGRTPR